MRTRAGVGSGINPLGSRFPGTVSDLGGVIGPDGKPGRDPGGELGGEKILAAQVIPSKIIEPEVMVGAVAFDHQTAFIGREMEAGVAAGFADGAERLTRRVHP